MNGIHVILLFFVLLGLGVPVAYTMITISSLYFIFSDLPIMTLVQRMGNAVNSVPLLAIPTFIFAGCLMNNGGITRSLFKAVNSTPVGKLKGGLAQVNVLASLIFSGMSGAALADLGGLGNIEIKAMREHGYSLEEATAVTLASSAIGPIFPPSIPLLIFSAIAQVSGVRLLLAGVVPGILMTIILLIQVGIFARKRNFPKGNIEGSWQERLMDQVKALPAFLAPVILLGGLVMGTYSPTELASVAAVYSLILGFFVYRGLNVQTFFAAAKEAVISISNILFIGGSAIIFSFVLTIEQIPMLFKGMLMNISDHWLVLLVMTNLILLLVGMIMDTLVAFLVFTPIILPTLVAAGLDPVHVGIVMCLNLVIGLYTPPFGTCLFMASVLTKLPLQKIVKALAPYYIPLLLSLVIVSVFPDLCLWLPNLVFGK